MFILLLLNKIFFFLALSSDIIFGGSRFHFNLQNHECFFFLKQKWIIQNHVPFFEQNKNLG